MNDLVLSELPVVIENEHAYLKDAGDRIAVIQFKSKGNSVSIGVRAFIEDVLDNHADKFEGLVIANDGKHFSVGANVSEMRDKILLKQFESLEKGIESFQNLNYKIKYYNKPIVSAPFKMALGGGLEIVMHTKKSVSLEKAYYGLVEIGVGLVPGGGGIKESLCKAYKDETISKEESAKIVFKNLLTRNVSKTADQAREMRYLTKADVTVADIINLVSEAKKVCLELIKENEQTKEDTCYLLPSSFKCVLMEIAKEMRVEGKIYPYDVEVAETLTEVICGDIDELVAVSEKDMLGRERKGFLKQLKNPKTLDRINHLLETGKLLEN